MADRAQPGPDPQPRSMTVVAVMPSALANEGAWRPLTIRLGWHMHESTDACLALTEAWVLHKSGEQVGVLLIEPTRWLSLATRLTQSLADHVPGVLMFTFDGGVLLDHAGEPVPLPELSASARSLPASGNALPIAANPGNGAAGSMPPVLVEAPNATDGHPTVSAPPATGWRITREEIDMLLHDRPAHPGGGSP